MKLLISFIILSVIVFYGFNLAFVIAHEDVHKQIFESYGVNSTVEIDYLTLKAFTTGLKSCPEGCNLAHNINESVGYHLVPIMDMLIAFFLINLYIKIRNKE